MATNARTIWQDECEAIAMANDIEGYTIAVFKNEGPDKAPKVILEEDLRLSDLGGGVLKNPGDLTFKIQDAVFNERKHSKEE